MGLGAAASVALGVGVLGAGASLYGSSSAGKAGQQSAAQSASAAKNDVAEYNQTRTDLYPYNAWGQDAMGQLDTLNANGFTAGQPDYLSQAAAALPGQMTQAQLEQTPGYQFQLAQGLQATQQNAAAQGLGMSGAAMKGAAAYATGLANSNYQTQFNNAQTQYGDLIGLNTGQQANATNLYNRLSGTATIGENAAAQTGATGASAVSAAGQQTTAAGQAQAAGTVGSANALTNGANSAASNYLQYQGLQSGVGGGNNPSGDGTTSAYVNPVNGQSYQSSSNPGLNF